MHLISPKANPASLVLLALCCQALAAQAVRVRNIYGTEGNSFNWEVYIDENPSRLQLIRCVEYTLYPTFPIPVREVCDARSHFSLEEKGRGEFTIGLKIEWRDRGPTVQSYTLDLHSENKPNKSIDPLLKEVRPTGMALLESGDLVFVDQTMGHILLKKSTGILSVAVISSETDFQTVQSETAPQICPIKINGGVAIAVVYNNRMSSDGQIRVFNPSGGRDIAHWNEAQPDTHFVGCAWDEMSNVLYVADDSPGLIKLKFDGAKVTSFERQITGLEDKDSHLLIAFNSTNRDLLAADAGSGNLYRIDPSSGRAHLLRLSGTIGEPKAIALSVDGESLYSIDGNRIRRIRLDQTPAKASISFVAPNLFKGLSSIVIGNDGQMWVGDYVNSAIYTVSPEGQVTNIFSAK